VRSIALILLLAASTVSAKPKTVTLDVKDADVRDVLQSLKTQCGVKNMIIDKDMAGKATFYLRDVPCETAFRVVLRTFNLAAASQ
jgi:type II secretory pathway component HofQ